MGTFADSLFAVLMSWVRALVSSLWALFTSERTTALEFLGKNWLLIVIVLVAAGLFIDWMIWLIRWKPYTLWAQRARRLLRIAPEDEEDEEEAAAAAYFALKPEEESADLHDDADMEPDFEEGEEDWLPPQPYLDEEDEQAAMARAESVPDEELGLYPGMRYDEQARPAKEELGGTRRFGAVHREGPGAEEVSRRREEIDAYKRQLEEEARLERERRMEAMRRAEEERLAEEARIAEEARLAEEARIAEEARLAEEARRAQEERAAQEEYVRQLAEYERQKAQYELELAQYQRDLAAYEAAIAAQNADTEAAEEIAPQTGRTRTRRRPATYSDMVEDETVETLPEIPQWPKMDKTVSDVKKSAAKNKPVKAHLIEPENEEIAGVNALPPRVDPKQAYKPATKPDNAPKRRRK